MTRTSIELGDVTPHNIKQLKKLNTVVFPVSYNDKFYIDVLEAGELAKLAYYNDIVVGAVCCRIDTSENQRRLYIMTLGCLYPYRRLGIGTVMFNHILNYVEKDGNFDSIFLHVQINNEGAIAFYKKFGFEIVETKEHYYKRIEPADAHVLQKTLKKNVWSPITVTAAATFITESSAGSELNTSSSSSSTNNISNNISTMMNNNSNNINNSSLQPSSNTNHHSHQQHNNSQNHNNHHHHHHHHHHHQNMNGHHDKNSVNNTSKSKA